MKLNTTVKFVSITLLSTLLFACNSGSSNGSNNSTSPSSFKAVTDVSFSSKNGLAIESDSWSLVGGASMPDGEAWSVASDNGVVYVGSGKSGNVYSSTNGGNWQTVGGGECLMGEEHTLLQFIMVLYMLEQLWFLTMITLQIYHQIYIHQQMAETGK